MLVSLSIRDVVLIERLDLSFDEGLSVFTGETGAGKSILLDSLGLALGARAEAGLVRHGRPQASVTAAFDPPPGHPCRTLLADQGIDAGTGDLVVRRTLGFDGRSRAFINDQPVSVGLLRRVGDSLVEIHGQFESHGLLDSATHQGVLDAFGGLGEQRATVSAAWRAWQTAAKIRAAREAERAQAAAEETELRAALDLLSGLAPKMGEEAQLAERRQAMMHGEKLVEAMNQAVAALTRPAEIEAALRTAGRSLERVADRAGGRFDAAIAALERAGAETAEALTHLERAGAEIDLDPAALEQVEERLFALRAAARRHATDVDGLVALKADLERRLAALDGGGNDLVQLARDEEAARAAYLEAARRLSKARIKAAGNLDTQVAAELPPLKLDRARFQTAVTPCDSPSGWGPEGLDQVEFLVATNPGVPPAALGKVASGGELARFMLALKVILAACSPIPSLVFDEVDSGIGGAVAAAVGDRLARLGQNLQTLVVTHSPQVAAKGAHHYRVAKQNSGEGTVATTVIRLDQTERQEEIARMLAGEAVTEQARAAALSLLNAV